MALSDPPADTARRRNPRGEGGRLREQLLGAAIELLGESGDQARVSVRAVAARAGVSPTALYLHFPDRDGLVEAAVDSSFAEFNATLLEAARGPTSPREQLMAIGRAYLRLALDRPALYAVLFTARRGMTPAPARDEALAALGQLMVASGAPAGVAGAIASAVWAARHGYARRRPARPTMAWPEPEEHLRRTFEAYLSS